MWIWLGLSGIGAWLVARSQAREWEFSGEPRRGSVGDEPFAYEIATTMRKQVRIDRVAVAVPDGVEFRVARETSFGRFLHRIGIGREIETGVVRFDNRFEIQSEDRRLGPWLRESTTARESIIELFEMGVREVVAHRGRIFVTLSGKDEGASNDARAWRAARVLNRLAACEPPRRPVYEIDSLHLWPRAMPVMMWSYGWATLAAILWLVNSEGSYPITVNSTDFALRMALYALLASPLAFYAAARWLRDSTLARLVLFEFVLIGMPAFVIGSALAGQRANEDWANGPILKVETRVLAKDRVRKRRGSHFYLIVEPWRDLGPGARFRVRYDIFDQVRQGDRLEIAWRPGALGQPVVVQPPRIVAAP